jgi:hypothetical protein
MGSDEAMSLPPAAVSRQGLDAAWFAPLVVGDSIRDYMEEANEMGWFPYTDEHHLRPLIASPKSARWLWPFRTDLGNRATFGKGTYFSDGRQWYEWHQLPKDEKASRWSIPFAEVATHNHFVFDRGGKIFRQTAPLIKLPEGATEDQHLALLGVLNSSTACFWLKQVCHNKGSTVDSEGARTTLDAWENFFQFNGANVSELPLAAKLPLDRARVLDGLAQELAAHEPSVICAAGPSADALGAARRAAEQFRARMIATQEELDWEVYRLYGLIDEDMTYGKDDLPGLVLGERAFEIALARAVRAGEEETAWFTRHGSTPVTEVPAHWPSAYRDLVQRRLDLIKSHPWIKLLERPEYKRRWAEEAWERRQERRGARCRAVLRSSLMR